MKRFVFTMCAGAFLVFSVTIAFAQDQKKAPSTAPVNKEAQQGVKPAQAPKMPTVEERADMTVKQISERIKDLSPDQKTKLKALFLSNFKAAEADRELYKDNMDKRRESAMARQKKHLEELKTILTKEQFEAYTKPPVMPQQKKDAAKPEPKKDQPKK